MISGIFPVLQKLKTPKILNYHYTVIVVVGNRMSLIGKYDAMPEDAYVRQKQSAPETCVVRENSVFGVSAANAAGMKCIAVSSGYYSVREPDGEKPDLIVTSPGEKEKILADIPGPDACGVGS